MELGASGAGNPHTLTKCRSLPHSQSPEAQSVRIDQSCFTQHTPRRLFELTSVRRGPQVHMVSTYLTT
ncbi:hypothetical protein E2C01_023753 [Portunus trituberculatus]|uniref:Uncharacterized protein n=1 Tax=Portunus trituberculatus TaxID=210409 RepID=A0A5B7EBD7_PORTR|nr:hypothetical protein [Portunus trituberculatus]